LLKWQHHHGSYLNFILAFDTAKDEIVGILGYIPLDQYDNSLSQNKDFWLAVWKIRDEYKGAGIELLDYLINSYGPESIGAIGINPIVKKLYKRLKYITGKLSHYYLLNPNIENFRIAEPSMKVERGVIKKSKYRLKELQDVSEFSELRHLYSPMKSISYLIARYAHHPIYKYRFFGVFINEKIQCILVNRKISIYNSSCIRIVDVYGELPRSSIESELIDLLVAENSEYIDCLNFGISEVTFFDLGFSLRENIVIPNYFEPFEQRNVDIDFAFTCKTDDYVIFKGDSDQDRPNII
jgi:hypothetical protein